MAKFRTRLLFSILILIVFINLSYLIFLFRLAASPLVSGLSITALAIIAVFPISFFLSRGLTRAVNALIKATQAISKRDFNQYVKVRTYSEIDQLIYNFNHMAQQLKAFNQEARKRNQDLERIAKDRTKELGYIYKIGREVSSTLELSEVLDMIIKSTTEVLNLKTCVILLVDELAGDSLKVAHVQGMNLKRIEKQVVEKGHGISGWVWRNKEALLVKDLSQDGRFLNRRNERYYTGSLISVPLEAKGRIIGVINANNKQSGEVFGEGDLLLLKEIATESAIAIENALLYKSLKQVYVHTIGALASALDAKDHYTRSHSENVTNYAVAIAEEAKLPSAQIEIIRQACQLHDLGKIGIHDYILSKSGKLTPEEWKEVKMHSLRGAQILQPISFLSEVAELIRQHHERFDGKGYPYNISGEDILLGSRIMTVADAFDAMTSERPYREALTLPQAIAELKSCSGTQFDPGIVKIFLQVLETRRTLFKHLRRTTKKS